MQTAKNSPGRAATNTTAVLQEAFSRFSEAGLRLEQRYQALAQEAVELRRELEAKNLEIKRQERLALLGETAAGIAHEVRNPLGAIRLFLSVLRQDIADRPEALGLVAEIEKSIGALDGVVGNILSFARPERWQTGPVNMHALLQELVAQLRRERGAQARFQLKLEGQPFLVGNEHGYRQVFQNLLLNALQATGYGGLISVVTADQGEQLLVTIADNGPGIPLELKDRIFDPFVSTKNEGTGLGLAIVKRIVDQHQGVITVCNQPGACFDLLLQRQPTVAEAVGWA